MKYMGSKARHAKHIVAAMALDLTSATAYVEPFAGGCNLLAQVRHPDRRANDVNTYVMQLMAALRDGWQPPDRISEAEYAAIRANPVAYDPALVGFVSVGCSYSGKVWGGYARGAASGGAARNYCRESRDNCLQQAPLLAGVEFTSMDYRELAVPAGAVVYCDPPYLGTTSYREGINHDEFWRWAGHLADTCRVYVSEYAAPDGWAPVWSKKVTSSLTRDTGSKSAVEKLFAVLN